MLKKLGNVLKNCVLTVLAFLLYLSVSLGFWFALLVGFTVYIITKEFHLNG